MRTAGYAVMTVVMVAFGGLDRADAQVRANADVACKPSGQRLQYDCIIKLLNSRTNEPLSGVVLSVGADMPSMPAAHTLRPVKAVEDQDKGTYKARLALEMHGDWALRLDISGPLRDRVVKLFRFENDRVGEATPAPLPGRLRH